jgi:hypothetical protein
MRRLIITVVLAVAGGMLALAPPASATGRYTVTATVSATNVDVGQTFLVKGHVTPRATGKYALVQLLVSGHWVTVQRARIGRYGNYRATVAVTQAGDHQYRVLKRRWHNTLRGFSPVFTVTGWRWRSVTDLPAYTTPSNASVLASGDVGATAYPATFKPLLKLGSAAGDDGSATYVLAQSCTKFDSEVGVTTDSVSSADQQAILGVIATQGGSVTQIAGQAVAHNQDPAHVVRSGTVISGAYALNLTGDVNAADTYVGWGNPRVYRKS